MEERINIIRPVEIAQSSDAKVAYDLMMLISTAEKLQIKDRKYWLTLYYQCRSTTKGLNLDDILAWTEEG